MAIANTGPISVDTIRVEWNSYASPNNVIGTYRSRTWFKSTGTGTFSATNLNFAQFYGTSPDNEWNCVCVCVCKSNCG